MHDLVGIPHVGLALHAVIGTSQVSVTPRKPGRCEAGLRDVVGHAHVIVGLRGVGNIAYVATRRNGSHGVGLSDRDVCASQ
jgi:hypothetical protein